MLSLDELIACTQASVVGNATNEWLRGLAYDSRADCRGRAFIALRTETGDGHDHMADAVAGGAAAVLCERAPERRLGVPVLVVPDVLDALGEWAGAAMRLWRPRVVAVTGSLGKTTTKSLVATILRRRHSVEASPGNLSGRLGLPVALAEMERQAEFAVLEFAIDAFGEMARLAAMAPPDVLVVCNVCEPHVDVFGSLESIAAEMSQALCRLPAQGIAVLNATDPLTRAMPVPVGATTVGFGGDGDVAADDVELNTGGLRYKVSFGAHQQRATARLFAPVMVQDCLAATAVGLSLGLDLEECVAGLAEARPLPGRMNPVAAACGATILDDTFSACPTSAVAALEGLGRYPARRRLVVLGAIDDWPRGEIPSAVAQSLAAAAHEVWALGDDAAGVVRAAGKSDAARVFYSAADLAESVSAALGPDDVLLVKGARGSRLERVVAALAAAEARKELVRQEPYWPSVRLARPDRPTWVEVDAEALASNTRLLRREVGVPLMAVLKADAYGHGAVRVARIAVANGADSLAVACLSEARVLRREGVEAPILVLGFTPPWQAREAVRLGVACAVFDLGELEALSRAAEALGGRASVHVKVDTGMARLGLAPAEVPEFMEAARRLPCLSVEGVFTHFGNADDPDQNYTRRQLDLFINLLLDLERRGLRPPVAHAANTAAALTLPESRLDAVRIGIGLYGLRPGPAVSLPEGCRPVLAFKTTVSQVRSIDAGTYVGYGRVYLATGPRRVATIPVGYADGFRRGPLNWGEVLIRSHRCPIIGNVCMDQAMVDVSDAPGVAKGDEVVLIGRQGEASISAEEVAGRLGTISYEVISAILARVPRTI